MNTVTTPTVIGINGKIGSGKDAIAARLVEKWGFKIIRFSDALKREVLVRLPETLRAIYESYTEDRRTGYGKPRFDYSPYPSEITDKRLEELGIDLQWMVWDDKPPIVRALLQEYGTQVRRADDSDYWVHQWVHAVYEAIDQGHMRIVTPDMRFPNEATAVRYTQRGVLWKVTRPGHWGNGHISETALDSYKGIEVHLENTGSLEDLWAKVDEQVAVLLGEKA